MQFLTVNNIDRGRERPWRSHSWWVGEGGPDYIVVIYGDGDDI